MPKMISLPAHILNLPAYTPIEPFEVLSARIGKTPAQIVKLDANENPYGMSPRAQQALSSLQYAHIYPDPESRSLRDRISKFTGVPAQNIMAGAGADELIDLIMRVCLEPDEVILNCPPTFGMYQFDGDLNAARVVNVPRQSDFSLDLPALHLAISTLRPKLIFLTSPNNPDGSLIDVQVIRKLMEYPALVVLDEAYIEFADPKNLGREKSLAVLAAQSENLIVLRTFSKLAGLAGLRVGYGIFPDWLLPTLWKAKQPYNVNVAASTAASAALEDLDYLHTTVTKIVAERQRLFWALSENHQLAVFASNANFLLCRLTDANAQLIKQRLANEFGIFIRYFNKPGIEDCLRVSVGTPSQNDQFLHTFAQLLAEK